MRDDRIFQFRLYLAGETPNSIRAVTNLNAFCRRYLVDHYEIEIVDVLKEPKRVLVDDILMTPTLVKIFPLPVIKVVGTLSDWEPILSALGLSALHS